MQIMYFHRAPDCLFIKNWPRLLFAYTILFVIHNALLTLMSHQAAYVICVFIYSAMHSQTKFHYALIIRKADVF